ncbi:MAG: hypothetical protein LBV45_03925 [Xanthomonadaceae bacterium]|nr:hypothetical protein [Xanthomonadaceae bacterium]
MAERKPSDEDATVTALPQGSGESVPAGFWISEENYNRLERTLKLATMLACIDAQVAEHAAISRDSIATAVGYIADDLRIVLDESIFTTNRYRGKVSHG